MTAISPCFRFADANVLQVEDDDESNWKLEAGEVTPPLAELSAIRNRYIYVFQRLDGAAASLYGEYAADSSSALGFCSGESRQHVDPDDPGAIFEGLGASEVSLPDNVNGKHAEYFFLATRVRLKSAAIRYVMDSKPGCLPWVNVASITACVFDDRGSAYVPVVDPLFVARQLNVHYTEACNALLNTSVTYAGQPAPLRVRIQWRHHILMIAKLLRQLLDGDNRSQLVGCLHDGSGASVEKFIGDHEQEMDSLIKERDRRGARLSKFLGSELIRLTEELYTQAGTDGASAFLEGMAAGSERLNECPNGRARIGEWLRNPPRWVSQYVLPKRELGEGEFAVTRKAAAAIADFWAEFAPALATGRPQQLYEVLGPAIQYVTRSVVITFREEMSYVTRRYALRAPVLAAKYSQMRSSKTPRDTIADWAGDSTKFNAAMESINRMIEVVNLTLAARALLDAEDDHFWKGLNLIGAGLDTVAAFEALGKLAIKKLRVVAALSAAIDAVLAFKDGRDAYQKGDTSSLVGYTAVGLGSALVFLGWAGATLGVGSSVTVIGFPAGLVMGVGGGILIAAGYIVAVFGADTELQSFVKHCHFGSQYGEGEASPGWAEGTFASWADGVEGSTRQVKALYNVLAAFTVKGLPPSTALAADAAFELTPGLLKENSKLHMEYTARWVDSTEPTKTVDRQEGYCLLTLEPQGANGTLSLVDYSGVFESAAPKTTADGSGRLKIVVQLQRRRNANNTPPAIELADLALKMRLDLYGDGTPAACGADATVWVPSGVNDGKRLNAVMMRKGESPTDTYSTLADGDLV